MRKAAYLTPIPPYDMDAMNIDLSSCTYSELGQIIRAANARLAQLRLQRRRELASRILAEIAQAGLTLDEVFPATPPSAPPKYRHPDNAELNWDGAGVPPSWFRDLLSTGQRRVDLRVRPVKAARTPADAADRPRRSIAGLFRSMPLR
jgi:DNA-binding protein H-NS